MNHYRKIQLPDLPEALGIVDQPSPMLQWVEIGSMVIDDRYQRPLLVLDAAEKLAKEEKRAVSAVAREMFAALIRRNLAEAKPND